MKAKQVNYFIHIKDIVTGTLSLFLVSYLLQYKLDL